MKNSQAGQIRIRLQVARGGWISALALHEASGSLCVHSRIADLRRQGHEIENRTGHTAGRVVSEYRLLAKADAHSAAPAPTHPSIKPEKQFELAVPQNRVWPD